MGDKPSKQDWESLAAKESRGKDLSRETVEDIRLNTVYGPEDAADGLGCMRLGVPRRMLRWPAHQKQQNA